MSWFDGPPLDSREALERADQAQRWLIETLAALEGLLTTRNDLQVTVIATIQIAAGDRAAREQVYQIERQLYTAYPGVPLELRVVEAKDETSADEPPTAGPPD